MGVFVHPSHNERTYYLHMVGAGTTVTVTVDSKNQNVMVIISYFVGRCRQLRGLGQQ